MWWIGVDTGGTFTDLVATSDAGEVRRVKVPSTPPNFEAGVLAAARGAEVPLPDVSLFMHGTTVTTNAIITRSGAPTAVVTTCGFRDVLELRRHNRDEQFDLFWDPPEPLVRGRNRFEVTERLNYRGEVVSPLDEEDVRRIARMVNRRGIEAVAVVFLHSYLNPTHEQQAADLFRRLLPDAYVCASNEILREANEFERTSTTVANAYLGPVFDAYVRRLIAELRDSGCRSPVMLMHSGGGLMPASSIVDIPARTVNSGPAAGVMATRAVADQVRRKRVISFDMGGTSTDIAVIVDGEPRVINEVSPEFGLPIRFPSIDLVTIGAGGGSVAWVDTAGYPKVGPQSAGALPGPACYDRGGIDATVTDANVLLGRLGEDNPLAGTLKPNRQSAVNAIGEFASRLSYEPENAALGVLRIATTNMANAIRVMTVQRGLDPRDFTLISFGGAGPMHAVEVARALSIPDVLVPPAPGVLSAEGLLVSDIVHDFAQTLVMHESQIAFEMLEREFATLQARADEALTRDEVPERRRLVRRRIDIRYVGQIKAISMPLSMDPLSAEVWETLREEFYRRYAEEYRFSTQDIPLEVSALRVRAIGETPRLVVGVGASSNGAAEPSASRPVRFDDGWHDTPVVARGALAPGDTLGGPCVVEQSDTTIVIPPGARGTIDERFNIHLRTGA